MQGVLGLERIEILGSGGVSEAGEGASLKGLVAITLVIAAKETST